MQIRLWVRLIHLQGKDSSFDIDVLMNPSNHFVFNSYKKLFLQLTKAGGIASIREKVSPWVVDTGLEQSAAAFYTIFVWCMYSVDVPDFKRKDKEIG